MNPKARVSDGARLVTIGGRTYAATDSGILSSFEPAVRSKPESVWMKLKSSVYRFIRPIDPASTSQQGTAAASPATYYQTLWAQRYERAAMIADCRRLYLEDTRVFKSINMYAAEATRGGVRIRVDGDSKMSREAQQIAKKIEQLLPDALLEGWARVVLQEGDLFIQCVVDHSERTVVDLMRMPAAGMERLTNDADEFTDPMKAYAQVDTTTWEQIGEPWPEFVMAHGRWLHIDGDRYGTPEIVACRRSFRKLDLVESAQTTRRMARGGIQRMFNIGTKDKPGRQEDIKNFQNMNGMLNGNAEPFDPMLVVKDYFGNGQISVDLIEGDPNIHEVADLRYLQNVACAGLPTPPAIYSVDTEAVNRDVLEDQKDQWLKDTYRMTQFLDQIVNHVYRLQLMLQGIDPELVGWTTIWSHSSVEKEADRIQSIIAAKEAGLISRKTAMANVAEYFSIQDIEHESEQIDQEHEDQSDPMQEEVKPETRQASAERTPSQEALDADAYDLNQLKGML